MELIDKAAVVAEIEKQRNSYIAEPNKYKVLSRFLNFIDTLEVKEVDLEKEIQMFSMDLAMKDNNGDWEKDIAVTAKHFFELGLKSKSSYVSTPNIDDTLKEMGVDPDSKSAESFKEFYYMALEKFKAQKGEEV